MRVEKLSTANTDEISTIVIFSTTKTLLKAAKA